MLRRELITHCSKIHTKHENAVCVQNAEGLNVKVCGPYSNHWALKGNTNFCPPSRSVFSQTKPISMQYTDMRHLTTVIPSEKWVVRRIGPCAYIIVCTYTNLGSTL